MKNIFIQEKLIRQFTAWLVFAAFEQPGLVMSKAPSTRAIFMWQFSMWQFLFARVDDEK